MGESGRDALRKQSFLFGKYETAADRESAYEILTARVLKQAEAAEEAKLAKTKKSEKSFAGELMGDFLKKTKQSVTRNVANEVGRSLIRGLLGSLFGRR